MDRSVRLGLVTLGEWLHHALRHPDCDLNVLAWWFWRYEPIEDES